MKQFALIGDPIDYSLSPKIHQQFAQQCGIEMDYQLLPTSLDALPVRIKQLQADGFVGVNVTQPLKQAVLAYADQCSDAVKIANAANTLTFNTDGTIMADNTDGVGFYDAMVKHVGTDFKDQSVLLLGAGGAARGIVLAIMQLHAAPFYVHNRTPNKLITLKQQFPALQAYQGEPLDWVINATTLSCEQLATQFPSIQFDDVLLYDLNYQAKTQYNGLSMLIAQAAHAFEIWHGVLPEY